VPDASPSLPAISLAKVDLPLPLAPGDAVVVVDAQVEVAQHRPAGLVADGTALDRDNGRGDRLRRARKAEGHHALVHHRGDRLQPRDGLEARLRLPGLRSLVAESLHEGFHVLLLRLLLDAHLLLQFRFFGILPGELVVAAAPEGELLPLQMHDGGDRAVEEVAVVADEQDRVWIAGEIALQPQGALEVEIVGRLVEQQEVGFGEEDGRERHAHAPPAGKGGGGALLRFRIEAEAGENGRRPRFRRMGVDIGKPRLDLRDPVRILRRLGFPHQAVALGIGLQHDVDQRLLGARRLLRHLADARAPGIADRARLRRKLTGDGAEEGGLARAVTSDKTGLGAGRQAERGLLDEQPPGDTQRKIVDGQHSRAVLAEAARACKPASSFSGP
jgi:hypothetical protein